MKVLPLAGDAELLAVAAQFWVDQAQSDAFYADHPWGDWSGAAAAEHEEFVALHRRARRRIAELQATTLAGLIAKARVAERFSHIHDLPGDPDLSDDDAVAWSLARDLLAMGGAA